MDGMTRNLIGKIRKELETIEIRKSKEKGNIKNNSERR